MSSNTGVKRPRSWLAIGAVLALVVTALAWTTRGLWLTSSMPAGIQWATGTAQTGDIRVTVAGSAALEPGQVEEVRSQVSGTVRRVRAKDGDLVAADQVLAEIENESVLLALEQARLAYDSEKQTFDEMLAGASAAVSPTAVKAAELKVENARLTLEAKQRLVDELVVKAPAAGLVGSLGVSPGDEVQAGAELATIWEGGVARVRLTVSENQIALVKAGDPASVIVAPLPTAAMVALTLGESAVYGLKAGDRAVANFSTYWTGGPVYYEGTVASWGPSGNQFRVVCRFPGVSPEIADGARAGVYVYPSGRVNGSASVYASGIMSRAVDQPYLDAEHEAGRGHAARVISVGLQGVSDGAGGVGYEVLLEMAGFPEGARAGMSAHGYLPVGEGGPVSALTRLEAVSRRIATASGGTVVSVLVSEGARVSSGQTLLTLQNDGILLQLEQARNDLEVQENNLRELTSPEYSEDELQSQELKLRQAELNLLGRQEDADSLWVRAPIDGKVTGWQSNAQVGRKISSGFLFCRVSNYSTMHLALNVDELEVDLLRPGMAAGVAVDALPGETFSAQVTRVSQEGQYQQGVSKFEVVLEMPASPRLRSQMSASAEIFVAERAGVLLIPAEAVTFLGEGLGEVNVVQPDGSTVVQKIEIGLYNDTQVEVLGGLSEGATVVTGVVEAPSRLFPGMGTPR